MAGSCSCRCAGDLPIARGFTSRSGRTPGCGPIVWGKSQWLMPLWPCVLCFLFRFVLSGLVFVLLSAPPIYYLCFLVVVLFFEVRFYF